MALLDEVKMALRVSSTAFDTLEIEPIIVACKKDLETAGVKTVYDSDPLIKRAVVLYAKANFGYDETSEKYSTAYEALKNKLASCGGYNTEATL